MQGHLEPARGSLRPAASQAASNFNATAVLLISSLQKRLSKPRVQLRGKVSQERAAVLVEWLRHQATRAVPHSDGRKDTDLLSVQTDGQVNTSVAVGFLERLPEAPQVA